MIAEGFAEEIVLAEGVLVLELGLIPASLLACTGVGGAGPLASEGLDGVGGGIMGAGGFGALLGGGGGSKTSLGAKSEGCTPNAASGELASTAYYMIVMNSWWSWFKPDGIQRDRSVTTSIFMKSVLSVVFISLSKFPSSANLVCASETAFVMVSLLSENHTSVNDTTDGERGPRTSFQVTGGQSCVLVVFCFSIK